MDPWRTAIVHSDETHIWVRGYDITSLMRQAGFVETVFLLHRGRLPSEAERRLLDALMVASADHGAGAPSCATARLAASGNRASLSAAIAAGVLAIGDEHGGAGENVMKMIAEHGAATSRQSKSMEDAATAAIEQARRTDVRLPGLGHRIHTTDPRVAVLFDLATELGVAGDGVGFMTALQAAATRLIKPIPINIDGAVGAILYDLSFPPSAGKLIFIIARVAGITAEVAEEHAREKPMRVRIPIDYDGKPPRDIETKEPR